MGIFKKVILALVVIAVVVGIIYLVSDKKSSDTGKADILGANTVLSADQTPTNLRTLTKSANMMLVGWDAPADVTGIVSYRIEWNGYDSAYYQPDYHLNATVPVADERAFQVGLNTASNPQLANGSDVAVRIAAVDTAGNMSPWVSLTDKLLAVRDSVLPTSPGTAVASAITSTSAQISWTPATDNSGYVKYYLESYNGNALVKTLCKSKWNTPSCQATGLTPGTKYTVKVKAMDIEGIAYYPISLNQPARTQRWTVGNKSSFTTTR